MAQNSGTTIRASRPTDNRSGTISAGSRDPWRHLAAAILAQAAKDAKAGDIDALIWLSSPAAEFLADEVGLSYTHVQKWIYSALIRIKKAKK